MSSVTKPVVGVISAGKVGAVMGAALRRAGHNLTGIAAISPGSLRRADDLLPDVPVLPPDEVAARAELLVLAVPDDVLPGLITGLVAAEVLGPHHIVLHTSGAHGVDVFEPTTTIGLLAFAFHPVMTFTGRSEDIERLVGSSVGITAAIGDEPAWVVGQQLAIAIGAEPVQVPEHIRPLYHALLTHGSNHLITLVVDCVDLMTRAGIGDARQMLAPLLSAALDNALRHGDRALTGPVARGDLRTVQSHLHVLQKQSRSLNQCYAVLAERTAERAAAAGVISSSTAHDINQLLRKFTDNDNG